MTQPGQSDRRGWIHFTLQGGPLTNLRTPDVFVDGRQVLASYGSNMLPVSPGRHTVSAGAMWIVRYGWASYEVDVPPGRSVPVFYVAPMVQLPKGRMGPVKQKRPGVWLFIVLVLAIAAVCVVPQVVGS